jgi:hypothetical protein
MCELTPKGLRPVLAISIHQMELWYRGKTIRGACHPSCFYLGVPSCSRGWGHRAHPPYRWGGRGAFRLYPSLFPFARLFSGAGVTTTTPRNDGVAVVPFAFDLLVILCISTELVLVTQRLASPNICG